LKKVIYSLLIFLLASCANRVTPTGGDKDIEAPKVLAMTPADRTTQFATKEIHIYFDEYVVLSDLPGQFLVSPLMSKLPEVKASKKEIIITLPDDLAPNTTYTLNFGKAIVDVHEANALNDFQYVFSTGDFLDSLQMSGNVVEASSLTKVKSITVLVYRNDLVVADDSVVFKKKPDYFSKTNEQGEFKISNMAAGSYRVFAVDDKNNNFLCDSSGEESLAFIDSVFVLPGDQHPDLRLSNLEPKNNRLIRALKLDRFSALISFNKRMDSLNIKNYDGSVWTGKYWETLNRDTAYLYLPNATSDSIQVVMFNGKHIIDTVQLSMLPSKGVTEKEERLRLFLRQSPAAFGPSSSLIINTNHPLLSKIDSASVMEDSSKSLLVPLQITDSLKGYFKLEYPWISGKRYQIKILPGVVNDFYSLTNDTFKLEFMVPTEESTAMISIKTENLNAKTNYLLQLINDKFELLRELEITKDSNYTFSYLNPGPVKLRIVEDIDRNHLWTYSHFGTHRQPEKVWIYSESITLRSNWEMEVIFRIVP